MRLIELYNTRKTTVRTGAYRVDFSGRDGFGPDVNRSGAATLASYHHADSNRDGIISIMELTRVIDLYSSRTDNIRTGAYHPQSGTEDGFVPGLWNP